jgi:hypothetical protein
VDSRGKADARLWARDSLFGPAACSSDGFLLVSLLFAEILLAVLAVGVARVERRCVALVPQVERILGESTDWCTGFHDVDGLVLHHRAVLLDVRLFLIRERSLKSSKAAPNQKYIK